jgi:hypothetical protein
MLEGEVLEISQELSEPYTEIHHLQFAFCTPFHLFLLTIYWLGLTCFFYLYASFAIG